MHREEGAEDRRINDLAREVMLLSRNTLMVNLRFLDLALGRLDLRPCGHILLAVDGKSIYYNPREVLRRYRAEREIPVRDYLHMALHCVFRHMYMPPSQVPLYWNLACDIAVENVITGLGIKAAAAERERRQLVYAAALKKHVSRLTAEKLYALFTETGLTGEQADSLENAFLADTHDIWYAPAGEAVRHRSAPVERRDARAGGGKAETPENRDESGGSEDARERGGPEGAEGRDRADSGRAAMAAMWKEVSEKIQADLETFSKERGDRAGALTQNLNDVNREKYDYAAFLKKFAVAGEAMKINDGEFDYIFYTYGLKLYGRMPLIEPLEYKEVSRIKEFVIAIDTSGSVAGELVQKFIQKTYNILKSAESFFSRINLHIIQCDAQIQEDRKITSRGEFDEYLKSMTLRGFGGTDFRPVFSHVEELRKAGEFTNLKGLIYFTDGRGVFPQHKPDYSTAFVFVDDEGGSPDIPPWAIKLVLRPDEI